LAWSTLESCSEDRWKVRDEATFDALLQRGRGCVGQRFRDRGRALDDTLQRAGAVRRALSGKELKRLPEARADLQSQLDDLLYDGVLRDLSPGRLQHYPRYLEAMQQRCERAPLDPAADARRMAEVQPWWQRYLDHIGAGGIYDPALDRYRWLIEEYRVSLFAQPLGTDGKVSPKRLRNAWDAVVASRQ
ncbi:MAG: DUF3418 domain-containing protein, partial [Xanthomonadales bacterium]|nr:DUF3418 domain-containing protein [Xanthomonadales bacterium]